jgi:hypothetical protein
LRPRSACPLRPIFSGSTPLPRSTRADQTATSSGETPSPALFSPPEITSPKVFLAHARQKTKRRFGTFASSWQTFHELLMQSMVAGHWRGLARQPSPRGDLRSVQNCIPQALKPFEGGVINDGFMKDFKRVPRMPGR